MISAITGATGVVGSALLRRLLDRGHQVRALVRTETAGANLSGGGVQPVLGDITVPETLDALVDGADFLFHVAGVNDMCVADGSAMAAVNVEGTHNVFEAAIRGNVGRVIHTSSVVTIGESHGEVGTEATVRSRDFLSLYEETKSRAEEVAFGFADQIDMVAVNPSSVQGPGRATGTGRLLLAAARGEAPVAIDSVISVVDIDDCAEGHVLAAEVGGSGQRYILSGTTTTARQVIRMIGRLGGHGRRPVYLSPGVLKMAAPVVSSVFGLLGKQPPLCPESARVLTAPHRYDGSRASRELGLNYRSLEETLQRTVEWFREENLL